MKNINLTNKSIKKIKIRITIAIIVAIIASIIIYRIDIALFYFWIVAVVAVIFATIFIALKTSELKN